MSALRSTTDLHEGERHVCFVPGADIATEGIGNAVAGLTPLHRKSYRSRPERNRRMWNLGLILPTGR
jgi:hypothetical protein